MVYVKKMTLFNWIIVYVCLSTFTVLLSADSLCESESNPPTSCAACIQLHNSCAWCSSKNFDDKRKGPQSRCGTRQQLIDRKCPEAEIESPQSETKVKSNEDLSDKRQIMPQDITLKLRPHQSITVNFTFRQAQNYPVDLYILCDKSYSMKDFINSIANLSSTIQTELQRLTNDWRVGVGFFVDKPVFPYMHPRPPGSVSSSPCGSGSELKGVKCVPTFSYVHVMSLKNDAETLNKVTSQQTVSANLDGPEGSLDALVQAVVCDKQVGWRPNSRKIVLLAVDGGFHMAGDGRFGGIIEPFPETECHLQPSKTSSEHLNISGTLEYINATKFDYPSIGQVAKVLSEKKVSVIFALRNRELTSVYTQLQNALPIVSHVDLINGDNIVTIIRSNYKKIAETVRITHNSPTRFLNVTMEAKCSESDEFKPRDSCLNVALGGTVYFRATFSISDCLQSSGEIVQLSSSTSNDNLAVNIFSLCGCPKCEAQASPKVLDAACQMVGHLECGVCRCKDNYAGDFCECAKSDGESKSKCRENDQSAICSGRGRCVCNKCVCSQSRYSGDYCQLDMQSCKRAWDSQETCGGPKQGTCDGKGKCICNADYEDEDCSCSKKRKQNPQCKSSKVPGVDCAGHGTCICGRCLCEGMWTYPYCDSRLGAAGSLCDDEGVQECVRCSIKNQEAVSANCNCSAREPAVTIDSSKITFRQGAHSEQSSSCILYDSDGCHLLYSYQYAEDAGEQRHMILTVANERQCPPSVNIPALVGGVVATVVVIGILLLLIWKLLVTISDRREYANFLKQSEHVRWGTGENPIFTEPTVTVRNPLYEGRKPE